MKHKNPQIFVSNGLYISKKVAQDDEELILLAAIIFILQVNCKG